MSITDRTEKKEETEEIEETNKKKAAFYTLGCKVNQYETEIIKKIFWTMDIPKWILKKKRMYI